MKKILPVFLIIAFFTSGKSSFSQCTIDFGQTAPGIYPDTLPDGYVGQSYSEDITFVLPTDTMGYIFTNFHILSISLPVGLNWVCNNSGNGCNYDPQVNQYGCVNVSGTPLLAGQYNVDVTVIADLNIVQGMPVTFQVFMEVLPSNVTVSNTGFSMLGANGCLPVTVNFTNNNPGLLAYEWDFGNGNTSTVENPAPQIYNTVGDFVVNYKAWSDTTTTEVYTLTDVTINTIQSVFTWGYPTELNPDPYFKIKENGIVIYNSTYIEDTYPPLSWSVNILLNPANTYLLEVWDEDDYEIFYGGDDFIGNHTMNLNGCSGCAAGTDAIVSYTINYVNIPPVPSVVSVDTVHVNGYPGEPNIYYDSLTQVLQTDTLGYLLQWYFNGSPIAGATFPTDTVLLSGDYYVVAVNSEGCVSFSDTITAVYCQALVPVIQQSGSLLSTPDTTGNSFQWMNNGVPIGGATNSFYNVTSAGVYSVEVTDEFGCVYTSGNTTMNVSTQDLDLNEAIQLFPNPAQNEINMNWSSGLIVYSVSIKDVTGKIIHTDLPHSNALKISLEGITSGIYFAEWKGEGFCVNRKLIIAK